MPATRNYFLPQSLVIAGSGFVLGVLPQLIANYITFGAPLYTDNWRNVAFTLYDSDQAVKITSFMYILRKDWLRLCFVWLKGFVKIFEGLSQAAYWPAWLALPGYILALRRTKQLLLLTFWGATIVLYLFLVAPVWRIELRYFLPVLPLIFASGVFMWRVLVKNNKIGVIIGLIVAVLISVVATVCFYMQ